MRLVVAGAGGGLGRAFLEVAPSHHDVEAFSHGDLDIADHDAVMELVTPLKADAILNLAAYTKVDACETDARAAFRTNALGVQNLALAARASGAVLLTVSTDYVFDGEKEEPYDESDTPNPRSAYARSKLEGERFARRLMPDSFVVRTSLIFGSGTDYISGAVAKLAAGGKAGGLADRIGTPTYVKHLAERLLPLLLTGRFGTYHLAGPEPTTFFQLLGRAKEIAGLPGELEPQEAAKLGLAAPRPRNSALVSLYLDELGIPTMPPLDQALKEFIDAR